MNVVKISDGLGNQMFQYAFARKMQLRGNGRVYLDTRFINNEDRIARGEKSRTLERNDHREYGLGHFRIRLPVADRRVLSKWNYLNQRNKAERMIAELSKEGLWFWQFKDDLYKQKGEIWGADDCRFPTYFQGYHFNRKYYEDIRYVLLQEFRLRTPIRLPQDLQRTLNHENTVSIHIRRGDYLKLHCDISETGYYRDAMGMIQEQAGCPVYLIFSDDIEWVKRNLPVKGKKIYVSGMGFADYEELAIMKHCRHNIIANSTFSYWAAYLNSSPDKLVICPKRWMPEIIPSEWIWI